MRILPGLVLTGAIAAAALSAARFLPPAVSAVLLALLTGLLLANLTTLPAATAPGIEVAAKRVLRVGVALLGARLTLPDLAAIGAPSLGIVLVTMSAAFVTVAVAGRMAGISPRLGVLLGTGTAVCGNSAIVAAAPIIGAEEREVSYAVATITIFGTAALILFPLVGRALDMPDAVFGTWAGLAINDTSQVVAAGAAYSETALQHATVVKLVRNALMAPVLVTLLLWSRRPGHGTGTAAPRTGAARPTAATLTRGLRTAVPGFVLAFVLLATLRSLGVIGDTTAEVLGAGATVAITVAIAGVGLRTRTRDLTVVGVRPLLVGLAAASVLAVVAVPLAYLIAA